MFPKLSENLKKLDSLELDPNEYLITGGAVLAIYGVRDCKDLDILVSDSLWNDLLKKYNVPVKVFDGVCKSIFIDGIEIMSEIDRTNIPWSIEEQLTTADIIDGKKYQTFERIKFFKKIQSRAKDLEDIKLIENYENII